MTFEDFHAIHDLVTLYARLADAGDAEGIGEHYRYCTLHMPGSVMDVPSIGVDAYVAWYKDLIRIYPDSNTPKTRRMIGTIHIEDDGPNGAKSQCCVICFQATDELPLQPIIAGTLYDRFEKVDDAWRIVERREELELVGDMSRHITIAM